MKKMIGKLSAVAAAVLLIAAQSAFADTFELRDGAKVTGEIDEITASLASADKSVLLLDDEELAVSEGADTISAALAKPLTIGSHSAEIISIKNGNATRTTYSFSVVSTSESVIVEDDMSGAPDTVVGSASSVSVNLGGTIGTTEDGVDVTLASAKVDGKDDDSAFAFICPIDRPAGSNTANAFITMSKAFDNEITLDMDLLFSAPMRFGFETKGTNGWGFPLGANHDEPLKSDGTVKGTSNTYPIGEWFHMKVAIDTVSGLTSMWINDELLIDNFDNGESLQGLSTFKIQPGFDAAAAGDMVAIDNLIISTGHSIAGFEMLSYNTDEGWISADSGIVPASAKQLRLTGTTGLDAGEITDKVKVYADGYEVQVASAVITADGSTEIELADSIGEEKTIRIVVDADSELGNSIDYRVKSETPQVAVSNVDFTMSNKRVLTGHQLANGRLMARGTLVNSSETDESVTVILAVYRDNKLVATKASKVTLSAKTNAKRVQLTCDIPEGEGKLSAEYFMIDSFDSRKPYSKVIAK